MPRGVYDRTKSTMIGHPMTAIPMATKSPPACLIGRTLWRVILHNGVAIAPPGRGSNERSIFHKASPWPKPQGRPYADELFVVADGLFARLDKYEKFIPWANVYEADLAPVEL